MYVVLVVLSVSNQMLHSAISTFVMLLIVDRANEKSH